MSGGLYDAPGNFAPGKATRAQLSSTDSMLAMMAEEVAELHPQALRRLMPVLQDARKELRAGLLKWLAEAPDGSNRFTAQAMRNTLLNLEGAIAKMRELEPAMADVLIDGSKVAGELSMKHLRQEVARMSTVFGESLFNSPQLRVADVITDSEKILIPRHRNSANRYAGNMLTDIKRQLGVGVARGETYFQLQQRLRRLGGPKGLVAVRGTKGDPRAIVEDISEGLFNRYRHWAQRVVRTEMSNSYNHHHEMGVRDLNDQIGDDEDVYMLRWDARNDGLCAICQALDRTAVKVGEQFAPGIYRAPAHPNCLCRVGAWRKDWGDMDGEVALKGKAPGPHATNWPPQASDELKERLRRKPKFRKAPLPMPSVKADPAPKKSAPKPKKRKAPRPKPVRNTKSISEELLAVDKKRVSIERKRDRDSRFASKEGDRLYKERAATDRDFTKALADNSAGSQERFMALKTKRDALDARINAEYDELPGKKDAILKESAKARMQFDIASKKLREDLGAEGRTLHTANVGGSMKGRDLTKGRISIDGDLLAEGYYKRDADVVSISRIKSRANNVAASHAWDGEIFMSPYSAEKSQLFLSEFAKSPAMAKKLMKESMPILDKARELAESARSISREADKMLSRIPGGWDVKGQIRRAQRSGEIAGRRPLMPSSTPIEIRPMVEKYFSKSMEGKKVSDMAISMNEKFRKTPGGKLLHDSTGHSTHVHEAFHGHGNIDGYAYQGSGKMIEEVITEVSARDHMFKRWGVPRGYRRNHGSYQGWIGGIRDKISELYNISGEEANKLISSAAETLKKSDRKISKPGVLVEFFADSIGKAIGGADLKPKLLEALERVSNSWGT